MVSSRIHHRAYNVRWLPVWCLAVETSACSLVLIYLFMVTGNRPIRAASVVWALAAKHVVERRSKTITIRGGWLERQVKAWQGTLSLIPAAPPPTFIMVTYNGRKDGG